MVATLGFADYPSKTDRIIPVARLTQLG